MGDRKKMKLEKKILCVSCALFFSLSICAAQDASADKTASENQSSSTSEIETVTLTIDSAVDYALKNSRTLKSNDIDLEIKKRASRYSWNVFLPNVQAAGTMSRANERSPGSSVRFEKEEDRWSTVGTVSASLNLSLAYIWQIRAARAEYEGGKISWEQNQKETVLNIKKLFYGLLVQQESLKIQKATLENARQRMIQAQTNFRNGTIPELSLLKTQVNYENTKPDVDTAEQNLAQQLDTFAFMLGMPVGTKIELEGSIEPNYIEADVEDLLARYGNGDLDIKALQSSINVMKLNLNAINISTWTPSLSVNYGWQPAYIGDKGAFHFYKDLGKDESWYDSGSLSLTLAWNITNMLPFSANRQKAKDLQANISKLEISMETLKENQKLKVKKSVDTLKQAREQIDASGRNISLAQRSYDMTYRSYRSGMTELLDLRDAETQLNQAKLGLLNQKYNYISALMDLEYTLNTDLSSGSAKKEA